MVTQDPADHPDISGDIREISLEVKDGSLVLSMAAEGTICPSVDETPEGKTNRYYYHFIIDTDNNPATGFSTSEYEGNQTGLEKPLGGEVTVQVGWRDGAPDGTEVYNSINDDEKLIPNLDWKKEDNRIIATVPMADIGLSVGQTIAFGAYQEGASDGWLVDWVESQEVTLTDASSGGDVYTTSDGADHPDISGDIREVSLAVKNGALELTMSVEGIICPSVDETPEGKTNRYYYHIIIDTDNNPATGFSTSEYEGNQTGLENPLGGEVTVQVGWRDGAPDGTEVYNSINDDEKLIPNLDWKKENNRIVATVPLADIGLSEGQTIAFGAYQEGASDGWLVDWVESQEVTLIDASPAGDVYTTTDGADHPDISGDIREISLEVKGADLELTMSVEGIICPSVDETPEGKTNRYYYHIIIDTDNNPATGFSTSEYEGNQTGLEMPLGGEVTVQVGWRDGAPDGTEVYNSINDDEKLIPNLDWKKENNRIVATVPMADIGLSVGQTIAFGAYQEGASDGWLVDWVESQEVTLTAPAGGTNIQMVEDPSDLPDTNGDLSLVQLTLDDEYLYLGMAVHGIICPAVDETIEGKTNRYYYHFILDTDNNPATGFSTSEYEGNQTGLENPLGGEITVQVGWRDGAPDGVYAYNSINDDERITETIDWEKNGGVLEARIPLATLGLSIGQTIAFGAYQEGASDGWLVDWVESGLITLTPPSSGGADLVTSWEATPYGFSIILEDVAGDEVDASTVKVTVDGDPVDVMPTKEDEYTTVAGMFGTWLEGGVKHTLGIEYEASASGGTRTREFPFDAPTYTALPPSYRNSTVITDSPGFIANVSQISDIQAETPSQHLNQADRAEKQLAGDLVDGDGDSFYNEASDVKNRWVVERVEIEDVINWHDIAPEPTGNFSEVSGHEDKVVPAVELPANGTVIEILTYLELSPGFHQLGVNTTGGFKLSSGPDGRDQLGEVAGVFNGSFPYSYQGNHTVSLIISEQGFYPIRLLWFSSEKTNEEAQLEFFSIVDKERVLINDETNPKSIKAYRAAATTPAYVSAISPSPGSDYGTPDAPIEIEIIGLLVDGSVGLKFDGAEVVPVIDVDDEITTIMFQPQGLQWGSTHAVELSYATQSDPGTPRVGTYTYGLYPDAPVLPSAWARVPGTGGDSGFAVRFVQSFDPRGNSVAAAEAQLASAGDFTIGDEPAVINYGIFEGDISGLFWDDRGFIDNELVDGGITDYFSMEALVYLELTPGAYTLGVNSDDGFLVTAGAAPTETTLEFDRHEGGRGDSSVAPQNLFDFIVETPGLYPFRLLWYQGTGGASVELYSYDRASEHAILVNDRETEGSINGYVETTNEPGGGNVIDIRKTAQGIVVEWSGTLESAASLVGPWNTQPGATSPMTVTGGEGEQYYRSR